MRYRASHPSATANKAIHCLKRGGLYVTKPTGTQQYTTKQKTYSRTELNIYLVILIEYSILY